MFERLPNQWTPVLPLGELHDNPVAAQLAGERVVLFRDDAERWHALLDRCPHRGAALSRGRVTGEGTLQCRYHGWRFDGAGRCRGVPLNDLNERALAKISATALPTRAIGGALWIFTGAGEAPEPTLPASLDGDPRRFVTYSQSWDANWTRAVENFIDFAHPPYLHEATIGMWMKGYAEGGGLARVEVEPTEFGMTMMSFLGSRSHGFRLDWYRPNLSILHFGPDPDNLLHVFSIPVSENRTRIMTVRRAPEGIDANRLQRHADGTDHRILDEDREIVETQPGDVLADATEISVATDEPTLFFRRWYRDLLDGSENRGPTPIS